MAFINQDGESISYECDDLIEELNKDIKEFGGNTVVAVWCKDVSGVTIYTNYDFIEEKDPLREDEIYEGEYIKPMTMTALLTLLEIQNSIF